MEDASPTALIISDGSGPDGRDRATSPEACGIIRLICSVIATGPGVSASIYSNSQLFMQEMRHG